MADKFKFRSKRDPKRDYTAQSSLEYDGKYIVMWESESGKLCGILYDESSVTEFINTRQWIITERLDIEDIW